MNSIKNSERLRPFSATQLFSKVTSGSIKVSVLSIAGATSAQASVYVAIGTLAMLGFFVSLAAIAFVALIFGVGILGLIGAISGLILSLLIIVSVAAILVIGSIFVPAGLLLVGGFFSMIIFSTVVAIVDILPACSLVALAFFALALLAIFM